ncbi:MAG: hypothetical protein M1822_004341 [Bathelium mastoideum]|nr:MAG: hypothetical protein M1822_004341 [Bathelium mastoideum]
MQHVYKNCVLNLSLSRASNPNESCFGGCSPDVIPPFEVKSSLHVDDESSMITWGSTEASAVAISNYVALPGLYYSEALYNQPLAHRAWALQERLLAPRVLSCGLGELFWECDQLPDASESFPEGLGGNASGNLLFSRDSTIPNTTDIDVLSRFWLHTLSDYVRCDLTYPETDKLVALAAVSNQMEIMMDDVCLAGHFWKTLIPSLNWFISDETRSPTRRRQGSTKGIKSQRQVIMPTWSWASMDGPLPWHLPPVKPVSLAEPEAYELPHHNRIDLATQENPIRLIIRAYCGALDDVLLLEIEESLHLEIAMDDSNKIVSGKSPYSIAALVYIPKMSDGWQGLILEAVEKDEEVIYKRVGHYALYNPYSSEDQKWKYDSRAWVEKMKMLHGQERKTITLI